MRYRLEHSASLAKDLRGLPEDARQRVWARIKSLADDPQPPGVEFLKGKLKGLRRVRVGGYRVGYTVEGDLVTVLMVDKRGSVYKELERRR